MSTLIHPRGPVVSASEPVPTRLEGAAVALSALVAVLYGLFFVVVRRVEAESGATESSTYGAYALLGIAYLVGTLAYALVDRQAIWVAGAVLQVVVIGLFIIFGIGLLGPGLFDYEALVEATPVWLWAGAIVGLQFVLFGLLGYLATLKPAGRHAA